MDVSLFLVLCVYSSFPAFLYPEKKFHKKYLNHKAFNT